MENLLVPVQQTEIPANLASECKSAAKMKDDTMGSMAAALVANTAALNDCRNKHLKLVQWASMK